MNSLETLLHYDFSDNEASIDEIESFLIKAEDDLTYGSEKEIFRSNLERIGENIEQVAINIIEDPSIQEKYDNLTLNHISNYIKDNNLREKLFAEKDFILDDMDITPEQKRIWQENKQNTLTKEQLEQIPDAILNFELSSNQKIKLALGEKLHLQTIMMIGTIFSKTKDNKISATYRGTGEEFLLSNRAIKLINQK